MKNPELYTEVNNLCLFTFFSSCQCNWAGAIVVGRVGDFGKGIIYNLILELFGRSENRSKNNIQINVTDM